jgi:hypothetical protein
VALVNVGGLTVRPLAGLTVSVYARLPVKLLLAVSVAVIVNVDEPVVVGVPLSRPVLEFSESHEGRLPELTAKV